MRTEVGPVTFRRDGELVDSETTLAAVGPNLVVATTVLPGLAMKVMTTYVGADDVTTVAVDLVLGPRPDGATQTRTLDRESVPVTHDRSQCLLDHASEVMRVLGARVRGGWAVDVSDEAVELAGAI